MNDYKINSADSFVVHRIGNKSNGEGAKFSENLSHLSEDVKEALIKTINISFQMDELYHFYYNARLNLNPMYCFVNSIFDDPSLLYNESLNIARHLYDNSTHPKIRQGELYAIYLNDIFFQGEHISGVALLKTETKNSYLKVRDQKSAFNITVEQGTSLKKIDKGCLILNREKEDGYILSIIDNINKNETKYWVDNFLHAEQRNHNFHNTKNAIALCRDFISTVNLEESEKIDILKSTASYFKDNESFNFDQFRQEVLKREEIIEEFLDFKQYKEEQSTAIFEDEFTISQKATSKEIRSLKKSIKLDNNFKISIDGDTTYLEKGYDNNKKMNFYKLYYKNEE